ncbi:MAG: hypothetical protein U9O87_00480 [Verrucomicrobiota bacterium]|nr:hypothetical protein [Verrucomicrobiota bacterium]
MNKILFVMITFLVSVSFVSAETKTAAFPTESVKTELTEEQKKQADENLKKASDLYKDVLGYHTKDKAETVKGNLDFIVSKIARYQKELKENKDNLNALDKLVLARSKSIKNITNDEIRAKKKRDLVAKYEERKDYMEYNIKNLQKRLKTLLKRKEILAEQYLALKESIGISGNSDMTWKEKDQETTKEADKTIDKIEDKEKQKKFDKYE